jgi:hypothetical protein
VAFPRGPLPRQAFRSFLATAGDPPPNCGGGVGVPRVQYAPNHHFEAGSTSPSPAQFAGEGRGGGRRRTQTRTFSAAAANCAFPRALSPARPFARSSRRLATPPPNCGGGVGVPRVQYAPNHHFEAGSTSPSPAQFAGEGRGGRRRRTQTPTFSAAEGVGAGTSPLSKRVTSPPGVLGERPGEGASAGASPMPVDAPRAQPSGRGVGASASPCRSTSNPLRGHARKRFPTAVRALA